MKNTRAMHHTIFYNSPDYIINLLLKRNEKMICVRESRRYYCVDVKGEGFYFEKRPIKFSVFFVSDLLLFVPGSLSILNLLLSVCVV